MKFKTTRKAIAANGVNVRSCGYCDLQSLLQAHDPVAYTSGVYGWNYDVYKVYGVTICTGYRGMPGKRLENVDEYEKAARLIWADWRTPYDKRREKVEKLLLEFCKLNGGY